MEKLKIRYFIFGFSILLASVTLLTIYDGISGTQSNNSSPIEGSQDSVKITGQIIENVDEIIEMTGTPADNYPPKDREQHCGKAGTKSTKYIQEFEIPTSCSQPLSIITDAEGNVWFLQTNTGNIAMFDPISEEFTEYENELWNFKKISMMWGIMLTEDNEIWFTDETDDFLWKFSINDKTYSKFPFPGDVKNAFPQKIGYHEGYFMINDFTGNRIVVVNHEDLDNEKSTYTSINTPEGYFTSQTAIDKNGNAWFIIWKYQSEAILIKTNSMVQEYEEYSLPSKISAPNGVSIGPSGKIWIADTASSSFHSFNPEDKKMTEFITSNPPLWTFGNSTGLIKTPITRPYWNAFDSDGNMWFNQQTANRLAVFNPISESLVEYEVPSQNPGWSDCGELEDCGISQNFGFTVSENHVWFTEWAKNNIGMLDKSMPLPITITYDENIVIKQGQEKEIFVNVIPNTNQKLDVILSGNTNSEYISFKTISDATEIFDKPIKIPITVSVDKDAHIGDYKILISSQFRDIAISTYVTLEII